MPHEVTLNTDMEAEIFSFVQEKNSSKIFGGIEQKEVTLGTCSLTEELLCT